MSFTVTVALQVEVFPFTSVTVNTTVFVPTLVHVNVDGVTLNEPIPQISEEPLFICAAVIEAVPAAFRLIEMF